MQIDKVLGIVGVLYVGEYDPEKHYEYLNCTTHNGSSYTCVNPDGVTGVEPGTTDDWQLSAKKGDIGPVGPKPVNGVDYNTDEEKEEFKNDVVSKATEEVKGNIAAVENEAIENYNKNADEKTTDYDTNASNKLKAYNDNTTTKLKEYDDNATSKVNEFNTNATNKTNSFDENATAKTNAFNSNAATKTNAFNDNYNEKMADINEASTSIENERKISDNKYARALKTQVEDVEQTQIYSENDEVEELKIKGAELTQETREGYNLLDYSYIGTKTAYGITISYSEDGYLTASGTQDTKWCNFISRDITDLLEDGKTYTLWTENKEKDLYAESFFAQVSVTGINDADNVNYFISLGNKTFTVDKSKYSKYAITIQMADKMLTLDNEKNRFMLYEGTDEKKYELYGASPSLDYPSEVEVSATQNIQVFRKNILDTNGINKTGGVAMQSKSDGGIAVNGALNSTTNFFTVKSQNFNVPIKSGKRLFINYGKTSDLLKDNTDFSPFLWLYDKEGNLFQTINKDTSITSGYLITTDIYMIRLGFEKFKEETEYNEDIYIELEISDKQSTRFQKYEATDISVILENSAIGNFFDVIDRYNNRQNRLIQKLVLTGDEDWKLTEENEAGLFRIYTEYISNNKMLCNYFKYNNANTNMFNSLNDGEFGLRVYKTNTNQLFFKYLKCSTVAEWKAKLKELYEAGTPVKIYYVAETPTQESLSEEVQKELDKFKLYDGLNNVFIDNGSLSFKYNKSLLRALEEQSELSASLLERVQALEQAQVNQVGGN